jgi:hypothetical protein
MKAKKKGHWFAALEGGDFGLIECAHCYLIIEARRLKEFAGKDCPDDKPSVQGGAR